MRTYKEILRIAEINKERDKLVDRLSKKIDIGDIEFNCTELVKLSDGQIELYEDIGNNDYLVEDYQGYNADMWNGYVYFKTDRKNIFVKIPISTY